MNDTINHYTKLRVYPATYTLILVNNNDTIKLDVAKEGFDNASINSTILRY